MDGSDEIRIPGERLQHRVRIRPKHGHQPLPQRIQVGKWFPCNRRFDRLPDSLAGIHLGTVGWLKYQHHIRGQHQRLGRMTARVVHQDDVQTRRVGLGKIIQKVLHHGSIQSRELHEVAGSTGGLDRPTDPGILETVLMQPDRFDSTGGNPPSMHGMEAKATLIARPDSERTLIGGRKHRLHVGRKRGLKLAHGIRVFLGLVGRGTFGLAPSLERTSLWTAFTVMEATKVA